MERFENQVSCYAFLKCWHQQILKLSLVSFFFLIPQISFAQIDNNFFNGGGIRVGDSTTACAGNGGGIRFDADSSDGGGLQYCDGTNWLTFLTSSFSGVANNGNSFAAPMIIGTNDNNTLAFETNGSTRITIDTSGNVGIGTSSPTESVDIRGRFLQIKGNLDNSMGVAIDSGLSLPHWADVRFKDRGVAQWALRKETDNSMNFYSYVGGQNTMTLLSTGNVGIGTTAPAVELDVNTGTINAASICDENNANCLDLSAGVGSGDLTNGGNSGAVVVGSNDSSLSLESNGTTKFTLDAANFYGSDADSPSLKVDGGGSASSPAYRFTSDIDTGMFRAADNELGLSTAGSERLRINDSGNVGIGTTSPDSSLEISDSFNGENTILKLKNDHNASFVGPALEFEGTGDISMGKVSTLWDSPGNNSNMYFQVTNGGSLSTALEIFFNGNLYLPNSGWGSGPGDGKININDSTAAANAVVDGLVLSHADSDNGQGASDGVGTRIVFEAETDTDGTGTEIATIVGVLDDTDNNSKDGSLRFHTIGANATSGTNTATERMRIDSSGNVGIGTDSPVEKLDVNGKVRTTEVVLSSDRAFKRDIASINQPERMQQFVAKIMALRPVTYHWCTEDYPERNFSDERQLGFIAQEVEEIFPELVTGEDGNKAVNYQGLISPLVATVQQQQERIEELEDLNQALKNRLDHQQQQIDWLMEQVKKSKSP